MAVVTGVDFGTLSVRVSIVDSEKGMLDSAMAEYPSTANAKIPNTPRNPTKTTCVLSPPPCARRCKTPASPATKSPPLRSIPLGPPSFPLPPEWSRSSFARFSTDDLHGKIRAYVGEGRFTSDPLETFGGAGVVEIPQMQKLLHYICENGFEHHVAANLSQVSANVQEAATNYLGWETYWHGKEQ
jgi:L-fucose isomerase, C-terminal domain